MDNNKTSAPEWLVRAAADIPDPPTPPGLVTGAQSLPVNPGNGHDAHTSGAAAITASVAPSVIAWGAVQIQLLERAKALQPGLGGAVDGLIGDTVMSIVPPFAFKSIADAIAKAANLEALKIKQRMEAAREALVANEQSALDDDEGPTDYEPDHAPVSLTAVADLARKKFDEWIDAPDEHLDFMILWCLGTWGLLPGCTARQFRKHGGVYLYPYLWLSSVDTDSGKSTVLRSLQAIVRRPMSIGRITPAALFRDLETLQRCGLVDEIGDLLKLYPDIASLLEMACYRDGEVKLTEAVTMKGHEKRVVVKFRLFGALAVASVERGGVEAGRSTLRSRSIRIRMVPSRRTEALSLEEHVRQVGNAADALGPHLAAHADAIRKAMEAGPATPLPAFLKNRRRDVWVHFIAIAELLGGDWPQRCLAACKLLAQVDKSPTVSDARDCLDAMRTCQDERIANYADAVAQLAAGGTPPPVSTYVRYDKYQHGTTGANYDFDIPLDFLPTLHFRDWLTTNGGAAFGCSTAGPSGRPITAMKLGRLLGDIVKGENLRRRQGSAGRVQVRGWSIAALEKVWTEEDRSSDSQ